MSPSSEQTQPSTAAIATATALIAGITGFFLGQASSLGLFSASKPKKRNSTTKAQAQATPATSEESEGSSSDDEGGDEDEEEMGQEQGDLSAFADSSEECKLVLVVRTDLGMTKGKIAAQCSHATLACYKALSSPPNPILKRWERLGQAKIAVQCKSEDELEMLQAQAMSMGVCAQVVRDAGRTQIAAGSATVLGVGPAPRSVVDRITGGLKLL